jgi:hypothetical protein
MTRAQTAPAPATEPKTHRSARTTRKKPLGVPSVPAAIPEFDVSAHRGEIAEVAYRIYLERTGSPEDDWTKAEMEVRARHAR